MRRRNTVQRRKILGYLRGVRTHPSAENVYEAVRREIPRITLATVYRNLNLLAAEGMITRLNINGGFRFDGDASNHQHCVCDGCGMITDVFQEEISSYAMEKLRCGTFEPSSVRVIFHGLCKECRKGGS